MVYRSWTLYIRDSRWALFKVAEDRCWVFVFSILHYSNTPKVCWAEQGHGESPSRGQTKARSFGPRFFTKLLLRCKFFLFFGLDISVVIRVPCLIQLIAGSRWFIWFSGGFGVFSVNYLHHRLTIDEMPLFLHHRTPFVEITPKIGLRKYRHKLENLYWKVLINGGNRLFLKQAQVSGPQNCTS